MKILFFIATLMFYVNLYSQLETKKVSFGEISAFHNFKTSEPVAFISLSFLYNAKKQNWQNGFRFDFQRIDLKKSLGGSKEYISVQFLKRYNYNYKKLGLRHSFGVGYHNYLFTTPYYDSRTNGIVISYAFDIGVNLNKIDLTLGLYFGGGYGYFKQFEYFESTERDNHFKFTVIGSPYIKFSLKK